MSGILQMAYNYVVEACNRVTPAPCGYSQAYQLRCGGWSGDVQYFDCSGLMSTALFEAGYFPNGNPCFATGSMYDILKSAGFTIVQNPYSVEWRAGDIVWYHRSGNIGHTEMVYDGPRKITMGAKGVNGKALPDQVAISTSSSSPAWYPWTYLARDETQAVIGAELKFIEDNPGYLSDEESWNNAYCVASIFMNSGQGWTIEAVCGILGNMMRESGVNPNLKEVGGSGWGLIQWTPETTVTNWLSQNGFSRNSGEGQCKAILNNPLEHTEYWLPRPDKGYTYTWDEFKCSLDTPENLASAYMWERERPGITAEDDRRRFARMFYEKFKNGIFPLVGQSGTNVLIKYALMDRIFKLNHRLTI